jgi:hypothetical protein
MNVTKFINAAAEAYHALGLLMSAFGTKRTLRPRSAMSVIGGKADIKSEQGLIAAAHQQVFWSRHIAFALGRDRQRMPGVQKIEDAIFQRVPFIFGKLGVAEVTLFFSSLERSASWLM